MGGDLDSMNAAELRSALSWWLDAGVDAAIAEEPRNWLAPRAQPQLQTKRMEAPAPSAPAVSLPESLEAFHQWLREAPDLPFASKGARRALPKGVAGAPVMLLVDMPPMDGNAWALMRAMLAAAGLEPDEAYIASLSCFHALGGIARGSDRDACADIARRHIALARPQRLLLLGDGPAQALLGKPLAIARGHVHKVEATRTIVTFHPSQLIASPSYKEQAWSDLLLLTENQ
jgi:uracil-DNA glycosylase